jgi:hypothetical protein
MLTVTATEVLFCQGPSLAREYERTKVRDVAAQTASDVFEKRWQHELGRLKGQ